MMKRIALIGILCGAISPVAFAQTTSKLASNKPIEIVSDSLEVFQNDHKAIFTGNVIATQDDVNMRADSMTVYYRDNPASDSKTASKPADSNAMGQGIYRIDSDGHVIFTNPTETAKGDKSIYMVDDDTIDLIGNVLLTRENNVLKGTHMVYNLKTGRSTLTAGNGATTAISGAPVPTGRVHGLFVPKNDGSPSAPAPAPQPQQTPGAAQ